MCGGVYPVSVWVLGRVCRARRGTNANKILVHHVKVLEVAEVAEFVCGVGWGVAVWVNGEVCGGLCAGEEGPRDNNMNFFTFSTFFAGSAAASTTCMYSDTQ